MRPACAGVGEGGGGDGDRHPVWDCQDRVSQGRRTAQSDAHNLVRGPVCVEPGPSRWCGWVRPACAEVGGGGGVVTCTWSGITRTGCAKMAKPPRATRTVWSEDQCASSLDPSAGAVGCGRLAPRSGGVVVVTCTWSGIARTGCAMMAEPPRATRTVRSEDRCASSLDPSAGAVGCGRLAPRSVAVEDRWEAEKDCWGKTFKSFKSGRRPSGEGWRTVSNDFAAVLAVGDACGPWIVPLTDSADCRAKLRLVADGPGRGGLETPERSGSEKRRKAARAGGAGGGGVDGRPDCDVREERDCRAAAKRGRPGRGGESSE